MARILGSEQHRRNIQKRYGAAAVRRISQALFAGGEAIQVEAQLSITKDAVSGAGHVPSAPGEPPNADTHHLDNHIETVQRAPLIVEVASKAEYSVPLEFGTSKMAARPFMKPATQKKRKAVTELVKRAVQANGR